MGSVCAQLSERASIHWSGNDPSVEIQNVAIQIDYPTVALIFASAILWARAAQIDGRAPLANYRFLWGVVGGTWAWICGSVFGHAARTILFDQLLVAMLMMLALTINEWLLERRMNRAARGRPSDGQAPDGSGSRRA